MPELFFKGKEFVFNHHLAVPFRPLVPDPKRSVGKSGENGRLDGNLIIHGDNLHALKALLPLYAGKVDCIFIDPPYNTGNEGWCYNDNVNSPMMREWLNSNPVGIEDGLRHDKWLAMMWPRLRLLHELLSEKGSLWMTLDDNENHRARDILDEIFGQENFVASLVWKKMDSPSRNDADRPISSYHDNFIVYAKDREDVYLRGEVRDSILDAYPLTLANGRKARRRQLRKNGKNARREDRPSMWYPILDPDGKEMWPYAPEGWEGRWVLKKEEWDRRVADERGEWKKQKGKWVPYYIEIAPDVPRAPWSTIWDDVDQNRQAKANLTAIFGRDEEFDSPKPTALVSRVLKIATRNDSLVLDSFAGSGTTGHAVLAANTKDAGNRRFILVECEDYADTLTAERVRRVIGGYDFQGTQREELHRERLTFTSLKKANKLLDDVESIKHLEGHRFDRIKAEVKDGELIVTGERDVTQKTEGLGGEFTYCTLGAAVEMDKLLTGENLPAFDQLGALLFHMATNQARPIAAETLEVAGAGYLGASSAQHVWLIYRPDLDFLKSRDAALTLSRAKAIAEAKPDKPHLVYAPTRFVSKRVLEDAKLPVEVAFAPLPFALYRLEKPR
jgi:adenine-specific DNA-methyltransferase